MTFKDCVKFCLRAPRTVWEKEEVGLHFRQFYDSFWQLLTVLLWLGFGLIVALLTPVVALMILAHYHKTKVSRAAAEAERQRQMEADV